MIRVRLSPCGSFKLAECDAGYGSQATASFIEERLPLLASEIQMARVVWIRMERLNGTAPTPEVIMRDFPQLRELCVAEQVRWYVGNYTRRTALEASAEILHDLFPTYSLEYIRRRGRRDRRRRS